MTKRKKLKIAVCYDFDGTLSPQYMQNVECLPRLGIEPSVFWKTVKELARKQNMDETLAYMNLMIDLAKERRVPLTPRFLMKCGKNIQLFDGLDTWFDRINAYGKAKNIEVEHYIITSGNQEIIRGTSIKRFFKYIFACRFAYKKSGKHLVAEKPAAAVNYTNKTQHLFRINKGIFNFWQNDEVNRYTPQEEKYIDFSNMIYIGDGETDVPCMKMVMLQGGHAVAVYDPHKKGADEISQKLYEHKRVNFVAPTDYSAESKLERIVRNIIDKIDLQTVR